MNANSINVLLKDYKKLERISHVGLDECIHKVTQEVAELIEATLASNSSEIYSEASDVLVNVLSVAQSLGLTIDYEEMERGQIGNPLVLTLLHGKWNQKIQGLRSRYSREDVSVDEASKITQTLVKEVLNYADPALDIEAMISQNTQKFASRVDEYCPDIDVKAYISSYKDFPKKGIDFKDISPILKNPQVFRYVCMELVKVCADSDVIVGLDSRGFLFGPWVAEYLGKPFVMARKAGKLPGKTIRKDYGLEYGNDVLELQECSIEKGQKVAIIDDLLATGGTAEAARDLVEKLGGKVNNVSFVISLDEDALCSLKSRQQLEGYPINSIVQYS